MVGCDVGVPQGSVLGPISCNCVMSALPKWLARMGIQSHRYADETQFLVSFRENEHINNKKSARRCIKQTYSVMKPSHLKLNAAKTQFIPFSRKLNFLSHVRELRQTCFFQLKWLWASRNYIPESQFTTLIQTLMTSRLDLCNSIF